MVGSARNLLGGLSFCAAILAVGLVGHEAFGGEIYRYRDPNGVVHFSNAPTDQRFSKVLPGEPLAGKSAAPPLESPAVNAPSEATGGNDVGGGAKGRVVRARRAVPGQARAVAVPPATIIRMIEETAIRYRIEKALLTAIVRAESGYDPQAVSRSGAAGLMQLMPATARSLGVRDVFHPKQNLEGGALYFRRLLHRFDGNATFALAAFNAGPTAVEKYGGVPPFPETRAYIERIGVYRQEYLRSREQLPHMIRKRKSPQS